MISNHSGRFHLVGGPFDGACSSIESFKSSEVCHFEPIPPFRGVTSILIAKPSQEGEPYKQRRDAKGEPMLNMVGDILYDHVKENIPDA
ncbi:hypothetical protein LCGC14_0357230 [marine sediment metagenome]|uniref:Uncharacterized protein n=1 Tax=marine sediment metagenome TaxID=412755 RepID=A0A0F9TEQ1_9ZZZZ